MLITHAISEHVPSTISVPSPLQKPRPEDWKKASEAEVTAAEALAGLQWMHGHKVTPRRHQCSPTLGRDSHAKPPSGCSCFRVRHIASYLPMAGLEQEGSHLSRSYPLMSQKAPTFAGRGMVPRRSWDGGLRAELPPPGWEGWGVGYGPGPLWRPHGHT
jgi:hypothetical protein